ncbi:helix-turn-helix transcriptional regulator [Chryseolinea sp. T2]|uniref:helix-turn-helix domain-containing protein n=1 Tax=Chryseolinea sp. T2 TaxID=3129255 RepID=UPI003077E90D
MEIVEIGEKIREVFENRNMRLTDFADELGTVRQNVYRIFKKRHVDTGLLLKISQVLGYNFFQYYVPASADSIQLSISDESATVEVQRQLDLSRKEIEYLRRIISLMEEKADLVQQLSKDGIVATS